jgi:rSAM/selenodomain-associated transferase 1
VGPPLGTQLLVLAKRPLPGVAKTRLCPPCSAEQAASLAEAALADTLGAVAAVPAARRVLVLDGREDDLPGDVRVVRQRGGGLAERLANAFDDAGAPGLLLAMDTPQVTPGLLATALRLLDRPSVDAVLGPALDGGFWAIGLKRADRRVFENVPMSTPSTLAAQRHRLRGLSLRCAELPALRDVDRIDDAWAVAAAAPQSRFAATLHRLFPAGRTPPL